MLKEYKVKVNSVDYYVTEEDIIDYGEFRVGGSRAANLRTGFAADQGWISLPTDYIR